MAEFLVKSPDGRQLRVNGPEGATQQQAIEYAKNYFANLDSQLQPDPPQEEDEGFLSGVGDFFTGTWQAGKRGFGTLADIPGYYGAALGSEEKFQEERA